MTILLKDINDEDWAAFARIAEACHNEAEARGWHQPCRPPCTTSPARKRPTSSGLR